MEKTNILQEQIQEIASQLQYSTNKADFVSRLYWALKGKGYDTYIVNDRYLDVEGETFMFVKHSKELQYSVVKL